MGDDREDDYGLDPEERYEPADDVDKAPFDRSPPHVETVLGPIRPEELGVASIHEHVYARPSQLSESQPDPDRILDDPHAALAELEDFYAAGGRGVLDATTGAEGRDIRAVHWIAARAPVHVVAVTGYQTELDSGRARSGLSPDDIAAVHIAELTEGIDGTGARAGAIVAGTRQGAMTPPQEAGLRGAARAHLATGAPILIHHGRGTVALDHLAILSVEGVDPARVVLGHQDLRLEDPNLRSVLATGAWISFDRISETTDATDGKPAAMIFRLVEAGSAGRLLVAGGLHRRSRLRSYGGGPGLVYLIETFPLILMAAGLDAPTVRQLLVENPAAALTIR